jgi:hypothetical protein
MLQQTAIRTLAVAAGAAVAASLAVPAAVADTSVSVAWEMNEPRGATTMVDSGPLALAGAIGDEVRTGVASGGATAYQWPFVAGINTAYRPERLVLVPNGAPVNPDGTAFQVEMRFRTKQGDKNIVNKGQSGNKNGFWKIETSKGKLKCVFRGPSGGLSIVTPTVVNDDAWHKVVCRHTASSLTMTLDDTWSRTRSGTTGPIKNREPMSIGGKNKCAALGDGGVDCDYYSGLVDYVRITKSG